MNYEFYARTEIGTTRKTNQDAIFAKSEKTAHLGNAFLGIVCDGMGGLSRGEVASQTVIKFFADWFVDEFKYILTDEGLLDIIRVQWNSLIDKSQEALKGYLRENRSQMGTTLSALLILNGKYYAAQIGDSRIYLCRNGEVFRITTDHSYVMELAEKGLMTYDEASLSKDKNILTRCIGNMLEFSADYYSGNILKKDGFLISSDGFHGGIKDGTAGIIIKNIFSLDGRNMKKEINAAVNNKMANGERDNISALGVIIN